MKRNKFLSLISLSFLGSLFVSGKKKESYLVTACNDPITPTVPVGPYYKDEKLNRIDITEDKKGTAIEYLFKVEDKDCKPVQGAIVDIWQCNTEGHYSDFERENSLGEKWLRGFQVTDKNGECKFKSIFPGWYTGRITHLHAKIHLNGEDVLITNFFFPKEIEEEVFADASLYPKGINPTTLVQDGDKDSKRRDTLLMNVTRGKNGKLIGKYKIALT